MQIFDSIFFHFLRRILSPKCTKKDQNILEIPPKFELLSNLVAGMHYVPHHFFDKKSLVPTHLTTHHFSNTFGHSSKNHLFTHQTKQLFMGNNYLLSKSARPSYAAAARNARGSLRRQFDHFE